MAPPLAAKIYIKRLKDFREELHTRFSDKKLANDGRGGRRNFCQYVSPDGTIRQSSIETNRTVIDPDSSILLYIRAGYDSRQHRCKWYVTIYPKEKNQLIAVWDCLPGEDTLISEHRKKHPSCFKVSCVTKNVDGVIVDEFAMFQRIIQKYGPYWREDLLIRDDIEENDKMTLYYMNNVQKSHYSEVVVIEKVKIEKEVLSQELYDKSKYRKEECSEEDYTKGMNILANLLQLNQIPVSEFTYNLKSMLDYDKHRKKNTMIIWGPSNTGKSLAFTSDLVRLTNFNFSAFQYSRLIHFEELDPHTLSINLQSTLKKLFEGDKELIDVNYSRPVKISSVPITITSNYDPEVLLRKLCDNDEALYKAFLNRIYIYKSLQLLLLFFLVSLLGSKSLSQIPTFFKSIQKL